MKLMDYTGRLNRHSDYLRLLKKLKQTCHYVECVIV